MTESSENDTAVQPSSELELLRKQVAELEKYDKVTNLYNVRVFQERLKEEVARSSRYGQDFSVLLIDIDKFPQYSSRFGKKASEEVLAMVGYAVRDCIRNVDIGCYYGDSKFAVILPHTGYSGARIVAERMREKMERVLLFKGISSESSLTASIGIASFPLHAISEEDIVQQALQAVAMAQKAGGNQYCAASDVSGETSDKEEVAAQVSPVVACSNMTMAYAIVSAVDSKDRYTSIHSQNVASYCVGIAKIMGLSGRKIEQIRTAGILHDIGKIGIPDDVIMKPGPLNEQEWKIMCKHPEIGANIISQIPGLSECVLAVKHHHERFDGKGYPEGLKGDQIPLDARIIAVAETYDNLTTPKPYRDILQPKEALEELKRNSGTQFDPVPVTAFIRLISSRLKTKE
jgi:diguanylate cyclase (GGDEF)-like protein